MGGKSNPLSGNPLGNNPISDILKSGSKGMLDIVTEAEKVVGGDININPFTKQEEAAKEAGRDDLRQRNEAIRQQKEKAAVLRRQEGLDSQKTSIILGGKGKRSKSGGRSISSSMGLQKGKTGLQG